MENNNKLVVSKIAEAQRIRRRINKRLNWSKFCYISYISTVAICFLIWFLFACIPPVGKTLGIWDYFAGYYPILFSLGIWSLTWFSVFNFLLLIGYIFLYNALYLKNKQLKKEADQLYIQKIKEADEIRNGGEAV
ncbi:hypothetical protein [Mycoplasma seminis]|uniref:Uncharacterized protein n=1 Tax=Mycoplasma seminis TaxID=512749 RepID=A0ABY9HA32_9MOLU|nr:hypothetical protein [Mycoplasma seminis]WLP85281.1 hypothetical protein Q8852_03080 [Mycoplasma seminis]